jgi:hemoglobin
VATVLEAAGGEEGVLRLARAWHERVVVDEVVGHAFRHGVHPHHTERLAAYWVEVLGGPPRFTQSFGDETTVVRMHSGNGAHDEMDDRAIACFDLAMRDVGLSADDPVHRVLHAWFTWATRTHLGRYPRSADDVPTGLRPPRWGWDGQEDSSGTPV